jgi:hypothetical protein
VEWGCEGVNLEIGVQDEGTGSIYGAKTGDEERDAETK